MKNVQAMQQNYKIDPKKFVNLYVSLKQNL